MTMKPNHHERIRADLKAYADGELSPLARFFVARHLRGCPSCRAELIQMQTLSTQLQENEPEAAPLSSDLRAHILDNAPTTDDLLEQESLKRARRVARKKMVLAVGVTSILMFMVFTTITGSKVKNTFNKAADSMATTDSVPSGHDPSVVVGGAEASGGAGAPPAAPSAASSARAGAATNSTDSVTFSSNNAGIAQNGIDRNGNETDALYADGHVKPRIGLRLDGASARRGVAEDSMVTLKKSFARQEQASSADSRFSVTFANPTGAANTFSVVPPTRTVHREGSITVAVENAESAGDDATSIVKNAGGFVANTSLETGTGQKRTAVLDCRVPVTQFETVAKKISALGRVRAKSLNGQDITAQVASSGARRQTLSNELSIAQARLTKLENSRKPKEYDLYRVRAEVRTLRIQASQARAALETLQKYGSLSSLYVSLQDGQPSATPKAAGWFDSLSPSSQAAWTSFLSNARLPLQLLLWVLAYSPLWFPALIIWRKYGRKWLTE